MAEKASVNLFALLDGNDPGDKRLVDFDLQLKDQPKKSVKKKPASAATSGYKPNKEQPSKKPASAAASTNKKPASGAASGFRSAKKNSPALATGYKAPRKNPMTPAVAATAPQSMAMAMNKQTTPVPPPAPSTNLKAVLFAYPSTRDRIFKQRQEEYERHQAKARQEQEQEEYERLQAKAKKGGSDDGKSAAAADKKNGKTHGVKVQHYVNGAKKQQVDATVKEVPAPPLSEKPAAAAVVQTLPPSIDDIHQFPSLK